jgi:hypothetical protein
MMPITVKSIVILVVCIVVANLLLAALNRLSQRALALLPGSSSVRA